MPKVSIILPAYNEEHYIVNAVDSVLGQTYADFELIVINDGSQDNTLNLLREYTDPRMHILDQPNQGLVSSLNRGIAIARGEYIARMDADDISLPTRLQAQVEFMDQHPPIGLLGTYARMLDPKTGLETSSRNLPTANRDIRRFLLKDNPFVHSSVMIRADLLKQVGVYAQEYRWEDYDLWIRICSQYEAAILPIELIVRRVHPNSLSAVRKTVSYTDRLRLQLKAKRLLNQDHLIAWFYLAQTGLRIIQSKSSATTG